MTGGTGGADSAGEARTPYLETEVLLDVIESRDDEAERKLAQMTPVQRRALKRQAWHLLVMIEELP